MKLVGLTGGIGTGKSAAAKILREFGAAIVDLDQVARDVVAPGSEGLAEIAKAFGSEMLTEGELNRPAMRARIAADPKARVILNGITHPRIATATFGILGDLREAGCEVAVVEAALMVETGTYRNYPHLWVVVCSPETQLERVMARDGMSQAAAEQFIATQMPIDEKAQFATHVIRNDGTLDELRSELEAAWAELHLDQ